MISDGTSGNGTITLTNSMSPEQLGSVTFADGSSVSLLQLIEQRGVSTTLTDGDGYRTVFSIENGSRFTDAPTTISSTAAITIP